MGRIRGKVNVNIIHKNYFEIYLKKSREEVTAVSTMKELIKVYSILIPQLFFTQQFNEIRIPS